MSMMITQWYRIPRTHKFLICCYHTNDEPHKAKQLLPLFGHWQHPLLNVNIMDKIQKLLCFNFKTNTKAKGKQMMPLFGHWQYPLLLLCFNSVSLKTLKPIQKL
jgi:hypothetical protein